MTTKLNVMARRIFNRLDGDIGSRVGIGREWDQIPNHVKKGYIRSEWEQIITEEVALMLNGAEKEDRIKAMFDEIGVKMKP